MTMHNQNISYIKSLIKSHSQPKYFIERKAKYIYARATMSSVHISFSDIKRRHMLLRGYASSRICWTIFQTRSTHSLTLGNHVQCQVCDSRILSIKRWKLKVSIVNHLFDLTHALLLQALNNLDIGRRLFPQFSSFDDYWSWLFFLSSYF